jgi:hypothetical protein
MNSPVKAANRRLAAMKICSMCKRVIRGKGVTLTEFLREG